MVPHLSVNSFRPWDQQHQLVEDQFTKTGAHVGCTSNHDKTRHLWSHDQIFIKHHIGIINIITFLILFFVKNLDLLKEILIYYIQIIAVFNYSIFISIKKLL